MSYRLPSSARALIKATHSTVVELHAEFGEDVLRHNLSAASGPRTGVQYPDLPRRSSNPREFSQEQSGGLVGMVDSGRVSESTTWFGLNPRTAEQLEQALGQELGNDEGLVGRANVYKTGADRTFHNLSAQYVRSNL